MSFSQPRKNDAIFIPEFLCALTDIRLCACLIPDIYKPAVSNCAGRSPGLLLIYGIDSILSAVFAIVRTSLSP